MFLGDVGFYQSLVRYEVAGHNIMAEPIGERLLRAGLVYGWGGAGHWSPVRCWVVARGDHHGSHWRAGGHLRKQYCKQSC